MNAGIQDSEALGFALGDALAAGDDAPLRHYEIARRRHVAGINRFTDLLTRGLLVADGGLIRPGLQTMAWLLHVRPLRMRVLRKLAMLDQARPARQ